MRDPFRPLSRYAMTFATATARQIARDVVERVRRYEADADQAAREAASCCKACWYFRRPRIGGAAMTTWHCGVCAGRHLAGSTATDRVCTDCATAHHLCTQCGGDLEMRERRRKWPEPATARG